MLSILNPNLFNKDCFGSIFVLSVETTLKCELDEAFRTMEVKLEHIQDECCKYAQRLTVVRQNLLHKLENPPADDHGDLYSETGSSIFTHSTGTSGKTFTSSKNRRKHERKKLRLKEGSPFEDLAIINELFLLYSSMNNVLRKWTLNPIRLWLTRIILRGGCHVESSPVAPEKPNKKLSLTS